MRVFVLHPACRQITTNSILPYHYMPNGGDDFLLFSNERQQSNLSCPFDSNSKLSLVLCTVATDTSRYNLSTLRDISSQSACVFIINMFNLVNAEYANLFLCTSCLHRSFCFFRHEKNLLYNLYLLQIRTVNRPLSHRQQSPWHQNCQNPALHPVVAATAENNCSRRHPLCPFRILNL